VIVTPVVARSDSALGAAPGARIAKHVALLAPLLAVYVIVTLFASQTPGDEASYLQHAENLTHGFYSGRGDEIDLWFGPGLPLFLTPLVALDVPLEITRLLGPALLFTAVVLFYLVLRLTTSSTVAFSGALALGCYVPALQLLPTLHSEFLALLFVVLFMFEFTLDLRRPRLLTLVVSATSLALLAVTRVVFGWVLVAALVLALAVIVVRRHPAVTRVALVLAIGLALTTPWLAYTYAVAGKPFYWSTSGGLSLYWMSTPYSGEHGDWHSPEEALSDPRLAPHRPLFERVQGLNQVEFDDEVRHEAVRNIREHPIDYVENVAANVSRLWFSTPFSYTPQKLSTTFYIVPNALLLTGLVVAAAVFVRARRRRPEALAFAVLLIPSIALQALLSAYTRMLVPLVPLMLWFVVQAAVALVESGSQIAETVVPTRPRGYDEGQSSSLEA